MDLTQKVAILTEGAKYDVSCSSSGGSNNTRIGSLGNNAPAGICHSFTSDGRCVSLLKILMSNYCQYDCAYCVNKCSRDIPRARLTPEEICEMTVNFYKRNYIEGLFLSSAVDGTPDETMGNLCKVCDLLRHKYGFNGYIHLKAIPNCHPSLIDLASRLATRMSVNLEFPSSDSLKVLAPAKTRNSLIVPLKQLATDYLQTRDKLSALTRVPAGVTTQLIVGATGESDSQILRLSQSLYDKFSLKRVYYSGYVPAVESSLLPAVAPHPMREHRLYEADWLMRFYGFSAEEFTENLSMDIDPKYDWARRNLHLFPVEINTVPFDMLLRIPGIGPRGAWKIDRARKHSPLRIEDLKKMRVVLKRAADFITVGGKFYGTAIRDFTVQTSLFDCAGEL